MEKQMYGDQPVNNRAVLMAETADKVEEQKVKKYFKAEEIQELKNDLTTISIQERDAEVIKAEAMKTYNANIKILAGKRTDVMAKLKAGYVEVTDKLYAFADQQAGMMEYYDSEGVLQYSRKLLPDERQTKIVQMNSGEQANG